MTNFFNFETAPVHPIDLSPDGTRLAVCNLPDDRVEILNVTGAVPVSIGSVTVGLDPVTVRFHTPSELWVANYISRTITLVDVPTMHVFATLQTSNEPSDIVFAGSPQMAFVSCGLPPLLQVFNPVTFQAVTNLLLDGERPRAMAASPDGSQVYVGFFESGNASTIISSPIAPLESLPHANALSIPFAPSGGQDPPPNDGTAFDPPINPQVAAVMPPPATGLIVRKNSAGRWMDDNQGDWTEWIHGSNAAFTSRLPGWDMPDHDLAAVNATNFSIFYVSGLMNLCMALGVNPASGTIAVVGTDAMNQIRFEPNLNGIFVRVEIALVDPGALTSNVVDLNPHLDYQSPQTTLDQEALSIGDPRGVVWTADGATGYVSGMGSDNVVVVDAQGNRAETNSAIPVGEGPSGLALDEARGRLYVYNRFEDSVSTVTTSNQTLAATLQLFNPTPAVITNGRPYFYNTHLTSGLGQAACASCHVDARTDRLAWDLGNPAGDIIPIDPATEFETSLPFPTNNYHPMKGPMVTRTLQDVIGHEPFHWRGDFEGLEAFFATFTNLQGMSDAISSNQMQAMKAFLGTIGFPPNPYRNFDNSLSTNVALPGEVALGRGLLPAGSPLPPGNAANGQMDFQTVITPGCSFCHTTPTGLGPDMRFVRNQWVQVPLSTNQSHHVELVELPRSMDLPFKIPSLRNLYDKTGMDLFHTNSRAGFGFSHDGAVDSVPRFIQDSFQITDDQVTADLTAFLFSFTGSDLITGSTNNPNFAPGLPSLDTPAAVGFQYLLSTTNESLVLDSMIALAITASNCVDLVAKGIEAGLSRGWFFERVTGLFQSDRQAESETPAALRAFAGVGTEQVYTLVPIGSGERLGIDRDADGFFDRDELDAQNLAFTSCQWTPQGMSLTWSAVPGFSYTLQYKNSLSDLTWSNLTLTVVASTNSMSQFDPIQAANTSRFYRVIASK
jgi:YVTN family beta-propeller protein